jgi:hypothetical protein
MLQPILVVLWNPVSAFFGSNARDLLRPAKAVSPIRAQRIDARKLHAGLRRPEHWLDRPPRVGTFLNDAAACSRPGKASSGRRFRAKVEFLAHARTLAGYNPLRFKGLLFVAASIRFFAIVLTNKFD